MPKRSNKNPPPARAAPAITASEKDESRLVAGALDKVKRGLNPTTSERSALRRWERKRDEDQRWHHYATIPQKHWRQMSGRQAKIINEQASAYGIPFGGATINLADVVRSLHVFLASNARRLSKPADESDLLLGSGNSPALERYRDEKAKLAKLDRLEREGDLVSREGLELGLSKMASIIRGAGEQLQRMYGDDAAASLAEAVTDFEGSIGDLCSNGKS